MLFPKIQYTGQCGSQFPLVWKGFVFMLHFQEVYDWSIMETLFKNKNILFPLWKREQFDNNTMYVQMATGFYRLVEFLSNERVTKDLHFFRNILPFYT